MWGLEGIGKWLDGRQYGVSAGWTIGPELLRTLATNFLLRA